MQAQSPNFFSKKRKREEKNKAKSINYEAINDARPSTPPSGAYPIPSTDLTTTVITPFLKSEYYNIDYYGKDICFSLTKKGQQRLAEYYCDKYQINITIIESLEEIIKIIKSARVKKSDDYRHAFIHNNGAHSVLYLYLKNDKYDGILDADSVFFAPQATLRALQDLELEINLYSVDPRQAAIVGCHVDSLVMARDSCRIDYLPNLLDRLVARSEEMKDCPKIKMVSLPDKLLKTVQLNGFVKKHREEKSVAINAQGETLDDFRLRYSGQLTYFSKRKKAITTKEAAPMYLNQKGWKYSGQLKILHYLDQLKCLDPELITKEVAYDFYQKAKKELTKLGPLSISNPPFVNLLEFTQNYLAELQKFKALMSFLK